MTGSKMTLDEALRARLSERLGSILYSDLVAHLTRDAVFVVATSISLLDCAVAVARDDVQTIEGWIASGALRKPSAAERANWPLDTARTWMAVVVQPFVLVQSS